MFITWQIDHSLINCEWLRLDYTSGFICALDYYRSYLYLELIHQPPVKLWMFSGGCIVADRSFGYPLAHPPLSSPSMMGSVAPMGDVLSPFFNRSSPPRIFDFETPAVPLSLVRRGSYSSDGADVDPCSCCQCRVRQTSLQVGLQYCEVFRVSASTLIVGTLYEMWKA